MLKNRISVLISIILLASMVFSLAACSPGPTPLPTDTPTTIPSITPSPTLTPTATLTPTPTSTPTLTLTPTNTPTLIPSPTPEGYYSNQAIGFTLFYPTGWQVIEKTDSVEFKDPMSKITVAVTSQEESSGMSTESACDTVLSFVKGLLKNPVLGKNGETTLGDGTKAITKDLTGSIFGTYFIVQMVCARSGNHLYVFMAMGDSISMKNNAALVDGIYKSMHLKANAEILIIKIASQSPLSGNMSTVGQDIKNGAELALEQLGDPLRSMGFRLELVPYDDRGNADTGVANARQIVTDPAILCVVGHYNSGVQIPSSEIYHSANLANVSPANTNPRVTDRGYAEVSRVIGRDDMQGLAAARFANSKGIKTAFVLDDDTTYGSGIADSFKQEAESLGIKVLGAEETTEMKDFSTMLLEILPAKPDLIFFSGNYDQIAEFIKQSRAKGYMGMFLGSDGLDNAEAAVIGGSSLLQGKGTYFMAMAGPASIYPGGAQFVKDFKAKYQHDPLPFTAQAYDAMGICLKGIENAARANNNQMPSRSAVSAAVRAIFDYKGITGTINFDKNGDRVLADYLVVQVTSANPARWAYSKLAQTVGVTPP